MKLSDLRSAADVHEQNMHNPEYKQEYDRLKLANDVAVRVLEFRTRNGLSQTDLARVLGMRQPNIARLESGEHEPSVSTLLRLATVLKMDFSLDIKPGGLKLRPAREAGKTPRANLALVTKGNTPLLVVKKDERRGSYVLRAQSRSRVGGDAGMSPGGSSRSRKSS